MSNRVSRVIDWLCNPTTGAIESYRLGNLSEQIGTLINQAAVAITGGTISGTAITTGSINNTPIGATTRSTLAGTTVALTATDSTGTPGNVTNNSANGRAAFAAAASTCVVTNSSVAATDTVQITLLGAADATLLYVVGVTVAAGSFTVTGNAAATAAKGFMFTVIKA